MSESSCYNTVFPIPNGYKMLILIFFLTSIVYGVNFSDEFIHFVDDDWGVLQNSLVQKLNFENQKKIWLNDTFELYYIPVTFTSFSIDVFLWGNNALYMKYENIVLFILSAFFLYKLLKLLNVKETICLGVIVFYLLHPIQVENVAIVTGRRQILNALFIFVSLFYLFQYIVYDRSGIKLFFGIFAFILSFLSKPTSFFLPFYLVVIVFYGVTRDQWKIDKIKKTGLTILLLTIISVIIMYINYQSIEQRNYVKTDFGYNVVQHILIIASSFGEYVIKIIKGPYTIFYPIDNAQSFNYTYYIFSCLITFCLVLLLMYQFYKKSKNNFLGILWYLTALLQTSLLVYIVSDFPFNVADRYFLVASPGIFLFILNTLEKYVGEYLKLSIVILGGYFTINSVSQIRVWKNESVLIEHNLNVNPTEEILNQMSIKAFYNNDTAKAFSLLSRSETLNKNIKFNNPYFHYLDLALIYQSKNDSNTAKKLIKEALLLDVNLNDSVVEMVFIDQAVNQLYPLRNEQNQNRTNYLMFRQRLINETGLTLIKNRI